jgi:septal ring factor EnvC (AmiA/AmiB activator)
VDTRKNIAYNFDPLVAHDDAVDIEGLEDLFQWASEAVTDANDPRTRRTRDHKIRRNVLEMIQHTKEIEAREKYSEEVNYLQRRVIALLQVVSDKMEENHSLKQIVLTQYIALSRLADIQEELKQLQAMTWYREEAEAERKHLMDALSKIKKERDYLDELVTIAENENGRLAKLYSQAQTELHVLKNQTWWQRFRGLFARVADGTATAKL